MSYGGKICSQPEHTTQVKEFRVYRYEPDSGEMPRINTSFSDSDRYGPMVLDALIKNETGSTPTFHSSNGPAPERTIAEIKN